MMSRLTPYRMFEITVFICVLWVVLTTAWWTWWMWSGHVKDSCDKSSPNDMTLYENQLNIAIPVDQLWSHTTNKHQIPVYIVEEHHEVLPYWFNSASSGIFPKHGNTLIHIDAHTDAAPPITVETLPLFRYPQSQDEIYQMILHNDAFILESVWSNLITRWIYIYSSWDAEQYSPDHSVEIKDFGRVTTEPENSTEPVCECNEIDNERHCFQMVGYRFLERNPIHVSTCDVKVTCIYETMTEAKALEQLEQGGLTFHNENIILDIDEDFYGCEAACMPLYDVGIAENEIESLKDIVANIFCPGTTTEEQQYDRLHHNLIHRILALNNKQREKIATQETIFNDMLKTILMHNLSLCFNSLMKIKHYLRTYVTRLLKYSDDQLRALGEVGLCLGGTPKGVFFESENGMRNCDGYNRPNDSMVVFHTPTVDEIAERTVTLRNILRKIPDPSIVTICRSMRDGYTPRKFFHKIESDVLESLQDIFTNITKDSIIYDKDLLGGRHGWPDRHPNIL